MLRTYRAEYERLLARVEKPGRYLGTERNVVRKDPNGLRLRFALAFPEVYEIAQSHLGLQILYDILNRRPEVAAERVYAPWPDMEALLREAGLPLASLESGVALRDFHIVGFSLQYQLPYTNLLTMLELGGIPLRAADRGPGDPLVIAGGPCAFNPEPLTPFLDAVQLGDGEEAVGALVDAVLGWDGRDRGALLRSLAALPGLYVPSFFVPRYAADGTLTDVVPLDPARPRVTKRVLVDVDRFAPPAEPIIPNVAVVHDRASVEVMRGCVKGCRFCQAGYIYRPLRERNPERVVTDTTALLARTGYEEVSLLSLSTGDYSGVNPVLRALMDELTPQRVSVSLPSTRVDALSPRILEQIRRVRKTGFTLAPEAGTQRLRDVIQKEYREEDLLAAARQFADMGWRALKLYFQIGLPSETEADVRGIAELAERVRRASGGRLRVTASVSTFSPKPHTPFQWAAQLDVAETRARQALLRHELARRGVEFRWHDAELSALEGVFSRGDRRLAEVLETAQQGGARFDGWSEQCRLDVWRAAFAAHGLDPAFYLRRRPLGEVLPWDHLDAGVSKKFLLRDLGRAVEGQLTPDCSIERCTYCGACDFERVHNVDYHPEGAKGGEHRGQAITRWAEMLVPGDDTPAPGWETRTFHALRERERERRSSVGMTRGTRAPDATPLPASLASGDGRPRPHDAGEGNAEEWLGAVPSSLAPDVEHPPVVQRLRLRYRKEGPARFLGGRELGSVWLRAARRARIPVAFSRGHHPLPRIGFGPALPLGFSSVDEYLDLELVERLVADEVATRLTAELPEGLVVTAVREVAAAAPSIDHDAYAFAYEVDVTPLDPAPDARALQSAVERFALATEFPVRKHSKRGERTVDARRFVRALDVAGPGRLAIELSAGPEGSLKPEVLVGDLLALPVALRPLLRVHKVATRFHSMAAEG